MMTVLKSKKEFMVCVRDVIEVDGYLSKVGLQRSQQYKFRCYLHRKLE